MYKAIAKQLNLTERQALQLKVEMEKESWLYSENIWKRACACYLYSLGGYFVTVVPVILLLTLFAASVSN
jgi:hypothetical protein